MIKIASCYDTTAHITHITIFEGDEPYSHFRKTWCAGIAYETTDVCSTNEQYERRELEDLEARIYREYDAD